MASCRASLLGVFASILFLAILGASYGSLIGIGILVSLIVWWWCFKKKNQQGYYHTVIYPPAQRTNNIPMSHQSGNLQNQSPPMADLHDTENTYTMIGPTQYGNTQGHIDTPTDFASTSSDNIPMSHQSGNLQNQSPQMAEVHDTENSYMMIELTQYGNPHGHIYTPIDLPSTSSGAWGNTPKSVRPENTKHDLT